MRKHEPVLVHAEPFRVFSPSLSVVLTRNCMCPFRGVKGACGVAARCATRTLDPAPLPPILLPAIRTTEQATRLVPR